MKLTLEELNQFHSFAVNYLGHEDGVSLEDLVRRWQERREYDETVEDLRQGLRDLDAGKGEPLREAFAGVRREIGSDSG